MNLVHYFVPRERLKEPSIGGLLLEYQAYLLVAIDDSKWWIVNNGNTFQVENAFLLERGRICGITETDVQQVDALYVVIRAARQNKTEAEAAQLAASQRLQQADSFLPVLLAAEEMLPVAEAAKAATEALRTRLCAELALRDSALAAANAALETAGNAITADVHRCSMVIAGRHYGYIPYNDELDD